MAAKDDLFKPGNVVEFYFHEGNLEVEIKSTDVDGIYGTKNTLQGVEWVKEQVMVPWTGFVFAKKRS